MEVAILVKAGQKYESVYKRLRSVVVCVKPVAEGGKANSAVVKLLSRELGLARNQVTITHGLTARRKVVALGGASDRVMDWLAGLPES